MEKYCLITNDVETTSLWNHCLSDKTGEVVLKEGMPVLLDIYERYNVKATFYFTGYIAEKYPDVVKMIVPYGHEVASHGYVHHADKAFDVLSYNEQVNHLKKSKDILESISNQTVVSFRAPALRVNSYTPKALAETEFLTDSSVAPQRMDMFLSFGSWKKMKWLTAPRRPYFTKENNLSRKGNGSVFEIPVSSFLLPYTGTMMRISPNLVKVVRAFLNLESSLFRTPLLYLIHPNELIEEEIVTDTIKRRSKSYIGYLLGDILRYKIKLKNLGKNSIPLLENQLVYLKQKGYKFITARELYQNWNNETISKKS